MDPLPKKDVVAAIERTGPSATPRHRMNYYNDETVEKYRDRIIELMKAYPEDVVKHKYVEPPWDELCQDPSELDKSIDARILMPEYTNVDEVADTIVGFGHTLDMSDAQRKRDANPDTYCLGYSWYGIFERLWMIRGMKNIMLDFYMNPEPLKKLIAALTEYHCSAFRTFGEMGYDGVTISDDLGTQENTMFSVDMFREFYLPHYKKLFATAHEYGMHIWMHSCGHVEPLVDDLIDAGLDALHPVQHTYWPGCTSANDPARMVEKFGDRLTFWAGIDVQYLMPRGTVEQVREGTRKLIDTFERPEGGLIVAAGNGIMPETPVENIEAFFDEAANYCRTRSARFGS